MKIEIKPFNNVVHFTPAIVFLRLKTKLRPPGRLVTDVARHPPKNFNPGENTLNS